MKIIHVNLAKGFRGGERQTELLIRALAVRQDARPWLACRRDSPLRARLAEVMDGFFSDHDALLLPTVQVPPSALDIEWVAEIDGRPMPTYIDWMRSCSDISVLGLPALSVPAAFTGDGLPVGLQIVGRPRGDRDLLALAAAFEDAAGVAEARPPE